MPRIGDLISFDDDDRKRADAIEKTFKISNGLYLVGSLETGVTIYRQQVRAHNLVWALWEIARASHAEPSSIAIVGGGITGLTVAACVLSRFKKSQVTVFEKHWDFCPLQLGCDTRWLHPRIYDWPQYGSRAPSASLPVLNWNEGRASDVARSIVQQFGQHCIPNAERLKIYLGLTHMRITAATRTIQWMGRRASYDGTFLRSPHSEGASEQFDLTILAPGYGIERSDYGTPSYWQNEELGQPILNGGRRPYLISGYGDGALVDLCRLTIERFRQDTVLYDLFGRNLDQVEDTLLTKLHNVSPADHFKFLNEEVADVTGPAANELAKRIRKDTVVTLHLAGRTETNTSLEHAFSHRSSFLNKLLLFLLYRCGAFSTSFVKLKQAGEEQAVPESNILCRYGPDTTSHVQQLFVDPDTVKSALAAIKDKQSSQRLWRLGSFPQPGA